MSDDIIIIDYDLCWPDLYRLEENRIFLAIAGEFPIIEHIGSTAVPGLAAKPIIDMMLGLDSLEEVSTVIRSLASIGYHYIAELEAMIPERRFLRKQLDGEHRCHLHIVATGSAFWFDHLLFRDILRSTISVACQYEELKRGLALRYRSNREDYTAAKSSFINKVIASARNPQSANPGKIASDDR